MRSTELCIFDDAVANMVSHYPFHFGLMIGVNKHYEYLPAHSNMDPTQYYAATWIENGQVNMEITRLFLPLRATEKTATIIHEIEHLLRKHLERISKDDGERFANLWRIATDIAINQDVHDLPDGVITVERLNVSWTDDEGNSHPGINLPKGLSSEEYTELLKKYASNEGLQKIMNSDLGCGKSQWKELDELSKQKTNDVVRKLVRDAADRLRRSGKELGEYAKIVDDWISVPNPWKNKIDRFVASSRSPETFKTWRKVNRHNDAWKGTRRISRPTLLIVIDTSASVADSDILEFLGHIEHIRKEGAEIWVMQCDYDIQSVEQWSGAEFFVVNGRGGTSFYPPFEWLKNPLAAPIVPNRPARFDGVIYLTDGQGAAPNSLPVQTLWGLTKDGEVPREGLWSFRLP